MHSDFFEDRIEIISIGGLPEDYSLEDFYLGRSRPVNLELQQIMVQLDFIEQTGHGVPLIVSKYGRNVFDITENFITVTLPLNVSSKPKAAEITDISLTNTQKEVIRLIKKNNTITISELSKAIKVSVTAINNAIKGLRNSGILTRSGARKNGVWVVNR